MPSLPARPAPGQHVAVLAGVDETGLVHVALGGAGVGAASVSSHLDPNEVRRAAAEGAAALVLVDPAHPRPVLTGIIHDRLRPVPPLPNECAPSTRNVDGEAIARVDGRRVTISGRDEIVLQCGKASITLQSDGKVVVKGTRVETDADGVNRIKGASVRIN